MMRFLLRAALPVIVIFMMTVGGSYLPPMETDDGASIFVVGGRGYATVNDALKVASPNDIIKVRPGIYDERVIIDKPIKIHGSGPMTIYTSTIIVASNDVTLTGHTFQDIYDNSTPYDWDYGGIVTRQNSGTITDTMISRLTVSACTFRNNRQGVFLFGAKDSTVTQCEFYNSYRGVSIGPHKIGNNIIWSSSGNTISDNEFHGMVGTGVWDGDAVAIWESSNNVVTGNTMDGNSYGVTITGGTGNTVSGNTISNSTYNPIFLNAVSGANSATVSGNTIEDNDGNMVINVSSGVSVNTNTFRSNGAPIELAGSSSVTFSGNTISDSSVFLNASSGNTFIGNEFSSSDAPTFTFAGQKVHYGNDIRTSNTVGGKAIHYYYDTADVQLADADVGSIMFAYCDDAVVTNTKVTNGDGVWVYNSQRPSIEAEVTNCLQGISLDGCAGVDITGSSVDASTRGWHGVSMSSASSGSMTDSTVLAAGSGPAFLIEDESDLNTYNVSFDGADVDVLGGILSVYNHLTILVWDDGRLQPLQGVEVEVTEDGGQVYATSHFGGSDATTGPDGRVSDILLLDRQYDHSNTATEKVHDVVVWMSIDAVWSDSASDVDMSGPRTLVFEAADIRAPATPLDFSVIDVPATDSIEITWTANADDTLEYSLYSNATGSWTLVSNVTGTSFTVSSGLVHGTRYWFALSAWDEVPLESPWTPKVGVIHADGLGPAAPTGLVATDIQGTEVSLGWAANIEADLVGYNLFINDTGGNENGPWVLLGAGLTETAFTALGLTSETMYHFTLTAFDEVPNESPRSAVLSVRTLDITPPEAPFLDGLPEYTNVNTRAVTGTAEPGSTVTVFIGGSEAGSAVAEADGSFSIPVQLEEGVNVITAWATDESGNTGPLSLEASTILDTVAPDAPDLDQVPEITNIEGITLTGSVEPLTTATVTLNGGVVFSEEIGPAGELAASFDLEEGVNVIVVYATDRASNVGPSVERTVRLDTVAPVARAGEDISSIEGDEVTMDGSDSTDDHAIASLEWTFTWDGSPVSLDGETVKYTFGTPATVTVTLTVTDLAGNVGTDQLVVNVGIRNGPPRLTGGTVTPGQGTTNTNFVFEVVFTDPDGDEGEVWLYLDGETFLMSPDPDDTDSTDGRKYTYTTKLTQGDHTYYFSGRDGFGNDADGPSAGEDNAASTPDVSKKKSEESPGPSVAILAVALVVAFVAMVARRRGS